MLRVGVGKVLFDEGRDGEERGRFDVVRCGFE